MDKDIEKYLSLAKKRKINSIKENILFFFLLLLLVSIMLVAWSSFYNLIYKYG